VVLGSFSWASWLQLSVPLTSSHHLKSPCCPQASAKQVMDVAKKISHCSVCNAPGVNKRSHVPGHKLAHKHRF
jgi:hypothetical protein